MVRQQGVSMKQNDEKLNYQVQSHTNGTIAIVNFSLEQFDQIPSFRAKLHEIVKNETGLQHRIDTGHYEIIDVVIRYFDSEDADSVNTFYSKPWPGCFSWLFHTRYYREHKLEESHVKKLIRIEVSTSHDGPYVLIMKSHFTEDEIAQLIKKAGNDLQFDVSRSNKAITGILY